jgi:hypothetical protein
VRYRQRVHPEQERAFQDTEVAELARLLVENPDRQLVVIAGEAIISTLPMPNGKAIAGKIGVRREREPGLIDLVARIYELGISIAQTGDLDWIKSRRGALLERLVFELIRSRPATPRRELKVELTRNRWTRQSWSRPKDVLLDKAGDPFEVYECKRNPAALGGYQQDDIDELADIHESAEAEGRDSRTCLAFLEAYETIDRVLRRLTFRGPLYYASRDELLELATQAPRRRLN